MAQRFESVSVSAGRDPRSHSRYEFHVMALKPGGADDWQTLAHETGFRSKGAAQRAGIKAAQPFLMEA